MAHERAHPSHDALVPLGWDEAWEQSFATWAPTGSEPARVAVRHKDQYEVESAHGRVNARLQGKLRYEAGQRSDLPIVGDWVAIGKRPHETVWRIRSLAPRRTFLRRRSRGTRAETHLLAANVDVVFVVMGLTEDFSPNRLDRYLVLIADGGARGIVVLNKADLVDESILADRRRRIEQAVAGGAAQGVAVLAVSAGTGEGVEDVRAQLAGGRTGVLVGSSGAGKSTLMNRLLGEERQATAEVRESDGRGRHTTTQRELEVLPCGGILVDSPGIREIQLLDVADGVEDTFADIAAIARDCRFGDCAHDSEPGCAVRQAVEDGNLAAARLENWRRLNGEAQAAGERLKLQREFRRIIRRGHPGRGDT